MHRVRRAVIFAIAQLSCVYGGRFFRTRSVMSHNVVKPTGVAKRLRSENLEHLSIFVAIMTKA